MQDEFNMLSPGAIVRNIVEACSRMDCEEAAADVYCRSHIARDGLSNQYYIKIKTRDDRKYTHYFDNGKLILESDCVKIADEYIAIMYRKKEIYAKGIESLKRYLSKNPDPEATSKPAPSIYVQLSKAIWKAFDEREIDCDQLIINISDDYETRRIKVQIFDKQIGCVYLFFIDQYAPGFDVDLAATKIAIFVIDYNKNINKNKEDNKMAQFNINCDDVIMPVPKSQEEIDRENKLIELKKIMRDKIKAAKDEYALAVNKMQEEEKAQTLIQRENEAATKQRIRYQACVDAGFTEEQAWKMLMQDLGA